MIAPIINHYKKLSFQNVENRTALCHCGEEPHDHPACKINFFVDCCIKIKDKNLEGDVAECGVFKGGSARILATVFEDKKIYFSQITEIISFVMDTIPIKTVKELENIFQADTLARKSALTRIHQLRS